MVIINETLLDEFRMAGRCSWCGRSGPTEPHHLFARGFGGGSRLDIRCNLLPTCRECHQNIHAGVVTLSDLLAVVSQREGCLADHVLQTIYFLRRTPNRSSAVQIERELRQMSAGARVLARQVLQERPQ
jgi:hypothetical protein